MTPEFESRRQRRELEAQQALSATSPSPLAQSLFAQPSPALPSPVQPSLAQSFPTQVVTYAPTASVAPEKLSPPPAPQTLSRRELRIREAAKVSPPSASGVLSALPTSQRPAETFQLPSVPPKAVETLPPVELSSRRQIREELRAIPAALELPITPFAQPWSEPANQPMFQTSSGFSIDTVTNSIVLPIAPDSLNSPLISDSGVTLKTGSIELPNLNAGTGSITIPAAAQIADEAHSIEALTTFVSDISPIAAKNLLQKNRNLELAAVKTRGPKGQLFYALTASMLMLTVGGLLVVAWMYGVIK